MKKLCTVVATALLLTGSAQARLGETAAQLTARFGEPVFSDGDVRIYRWNAYQVSVVFEKGISVDETYKRFDKAKFASGELADLLSRIAPPLGDWNGPHVSAKTESIFWVNEKTRSFASEKNGKELRCFPAPAPPTPAVVPVSALPGVADVLASLGQTWSDSYNAARTDCVRDRGLAMRTWLARAPRMNAVARAVLEIDFADALVADIEAACKDGAPQEQTNTMKAQRISILADVEGLITGTRARTRFNGELQIKLAAYLNRIAELRKLVNAAPIASNRSVSGGAAAPR